MNEKTMKALDWICLCVWILTLLYSIWAHEVPQVMSFSAVIVSITYYLREIGSVR